MVYDPVRDMVVPSPAEQQAGPSRPWETQRRGDQEDTRSGSSHDTSHETQLAQSRHAPTRIERSNSRDYFGYEQDPGVYSRGNGEGSSHPSISSTRSFSGEPGMSSGREFEHPQYPGAQPQYPGGVGSSRHPAHQSRSSRASHDHGQDHVQVALPQYPGHIHSLLNAHPIAPPISKSSSASSHHTASSSALSPAVRARRLDPAGYHLPATPDQMARYQSQSPVYGVSPRALPGYLPVVPPYTEPYPRHAGPSQVYSHDGHARSAHYQSPPPPVRQYSTPIQPGRNPTDPRSATASDDRSNYILNSPQDDMRPLQRAYSVDAAARTRNQDYVSPAREEARFIQSSIVHQNGTPAGHVERPHPASRTQSASSSSHQGFSMPRVPSTSASPYTLGRTLSPERSSSVEALALRRGTVPQRKLSESSVLYSPPVIESVASPSPIPAIPYEPTRMTQARDLYRPITTEEVAFLRSQAVQNNPLRRKQSKPPPSWSGSTHPQPDESDASYFPERADGSSHRAIPSDPRRSTSARPSITPGSTLPPSFQDDTINTPMSRSREVASNGRSGRKRTYDGSDEAEQDTARRRVGETEYKGNYANVAEHCEWSGSERRRKCQHLFADNLRPEVGVQNRELSPIIGLKKFNNWIKSVLIGKFAYRPQDRPGAKVLDIGCGKGGDLNKWKQARIQLYVGMGKLAKRYKVHQINVRPDIAENSIQQAEERYRRLNRPPFAGRFFAHDCYSVSRLRFRNVVGLTSDQRPISDVLPSDLAGREFYDNVTMQFCMHYAFESASKARMMIENVSRYLRPGGVFIGTIPDSALLL